ncbi:MAG: hypothetical protein OXI87_03085 [Albidovulum sp.]|nr:hypothetical protein [Albidovulum sp.]MDE0303859.1 hypothetical protein [Albidovulum sp.]MDE0532706.1 hypothetical protein [Albidovulum sp.]
MPRKPIAFCPTNRRIELRELLGIVDVEWPAVQFGAQINAGNRPWVSMIRSVNFPAVAKLPGNVGFHETKLGVGLIDPEDRGEKTPRKSARPVRGA